MIFVATATKRWRTTGRHRAVQKCRHTETARVSGADAIGVGTFEAFDGGHGAATTSN